jgi:hypothetical protein
MKRPQPHVMPGTVTAIAENPGFRTEVGDLKPKTKPVRIEAGLL